ncbi:unnamed protein product [Amoebophrya sp. A120]|nr:unnamed protein product [Amoebophrya sp. A120]|eukprot:GSA120T00003736001.1
MRRQFPGFPLPDSVTVTDYTVKNTDLDNYTQPYALPPAPPHAFSDPSHFIDAQLAGILESFREEIQDATRTSGSRPPRDDMLHLRYAGVSTLNCRIVADAAETSKMFMTPLPAKYPADALKSVYNKFMLLAQCQKVFGDEKVTNIGLVFCEAMNQKEGLVVRARPDVLEKLKAAMTSNQFTYFRKLRNFSFMVTGPAASLQGLRRTAPTPLCASLFFGQNLTSFDTKALDKWVAGKTSTQCLFNPQQCRALALEALTPNGPVIVQGPPGTGKSHLIARGILPQVIARGGRVLVLCNSNVAVDAIAEKVVEDEDRPMLDYKSAKQHCIRAGYEKKCSKKVLQAGWFRAGFLAEISSGAKSVVFTTLHHASTKPDEFVQAKFDTLILDEAGQVEDLKLFILSQKIPTLQKAILVGDHKQLQPYVSEGIREQGYGVSTMERLIASPSKSNSKSATEEQVAPKDGTSSSSRKAVDFVMLEEQHRMPPAVREVVSQNFYDNKLLDGPNIRDKFFTKESGYQQLFAQTKPTVVAFDLNFGAADFNMAQRSLENFQEAEITSFIYKGLLQKPYFDDGSCQLPLTTKDICVLSPYNRHKNRLRTVLAGIPETEWAKWENMDMDTLMDTEIDEKTAAVRNIDTVDKFQGSERQVVIINTVTGMQRARQDSTQQTKRACDPHFINVAMSRCKSVLFLVGKLSELGGIKDDRNASCWNPIVKMLEKSGSAKVFSCSNMEDAKRGMAEIGLLPPGVAVQQELEPDAKRRKL